MDESNGVTYVNWGQNGENHPPTLHQPKNGLLGKLGVKSMYLVNATNL